MKINTYTVTGEQGQQVELPDSVFGVEVNESLISQAVRVYLANQRQGNAHTKGRSDVTGSTRKIFKQKGTGNARHGDIKAPIFVGGGTVHGPVAHSFTMAFPVKMKRAALRSALSSRVENVVVLDGLSSLDKKTKTVSSLIKKVSKDKKKPLVLLSEDLASLFPSLRNVKEVDIMQVTDLNTYEVLNHDCIVLAQEAVSVLESWLGKKAVA